MRGLWTAVAALLMHSALGQQPAGTHMFVNYPGLSCKDALSTNVTCLPFLVSVSPNNGPLDEDGGLLHTWYYSAQLGGAEYLTTDPTPESFR
ncbi:uncharacterized protein ATNIH1004_003371 [Aspergillus tanneri]|uniref:Uncharacterized protein n=1 Tax=Aspergillus tanneri TaxID=1220188 RepID=A0A5M9N0K2_9EURO|nr:uncharacterized protein ATNIH1004_003371 [Aspergillus tanneri]KAA8650683.1 hypothetical protein ATNIH1004_003371 [Aspergillus tanneri]